MFLCILGSCCVSICVCLCLYSFTSFSKFNPYVFLMNTAAALFLLFMLHRYLGMSDPFTLLAVSYILKPCAQDDEDAVESHGRPTKASEAHRREMEALSRQMENDQRRTLQQIEELKMGFASQVSTSGSLQCLWLSFHQFKTSSSLSRWVSLSLSRSQCWQFLLDPCASPSTLFLCLTWGDELNLRYFQLLWMCQLKVPLVIRAAAEAFMLVIVVWDRFGYSKCFAAFEDIMTSNSVWGLGCSMPCQNVCCACFIFLVLARELQYERGNFCLDLWPCVFWPEHMFCM